MVSNSKKTALASYTNTLVTSLVGLLVNPLLLSGLGPAAFGTLKAIQRFFDVGGAANGGAMQALKWTTAYRSHDDDLGRKRRDVGASLVVLTLWSPVLIAVGAFLVVFLPTLVRDIPDDQVVPATLASILLAINMVVSSYAALPDAVLVGSNQGFRSMNVTTFATTLVNVAMVGVAASGLGLPAIASVILGGTVVNGVITFIIARRRISWFRIARPLRSDVKDLNSFSGWVLVWALTNRVLLASEVLLFAVLLGADAVSAYTFTGYVVQLALAVCLMTTSAQMPKLGASLGAKKTEAVTREARVIREIALASATIFACLTALLNSSFVSVWAGPSQFLGLPVNALMAVGLFQLAIIRTDGQIQDTGLKIRSKVIVGIAMTIISYLAAFASYLLSSSIEMLFVGLIVGRMLGSIVFPLLANRTIGSRSWPVLRLVIGLGLLGASIALSPLIHLDGWLSLIVGGVATTAIVVPLVLFTVLSPSTRRRVVRLRRRR